MSDREPLPTAVRTVPGARGNPQRSDRVPARAQRCGPYLAHGASRNGPTACLPAHSGADRSLRSGQSATVRPRAGPNYSSFKHCVGLILDALSACIPTVTIAIHTAIRPAAIKYPGSSFILYANPSSHFINIR